MTLYEEVVSILDADDDKDKNEITMWGGLGAADDRTFARGDVHEEHLDKPFPNDIQFSRAFLDSEYVNDYLREYAVYQFWRDGETCYIHFDLIKMNGFSGQTRRYQVNLVGHKPIFERAEK